MPPYSVPKSAPSVEIPKMTPKEIAYSFRSRAEALGGHQIFREDGSPLIGAIYAGAPMSAPRKRTYKGKQVICSADCCTNNSRKPIGTHYYSKSYKLDADLKSDANAKADSDANAESHANPWIKVESRNARRLRYKRLKNQALYHDKE